MDQKDPQPFGYTFDTAADYLGGSPTAFTNGGPQLLSPGENNFLTEFFTTTDPFLSDASQFPPPSNDTGGGASDFQWTFPPPATIHQVSTTIPDQSQLHHPFNDHAFAPTSLSGNDMAHTQDDLQAASTLFSNANSHVNNQAHQLNGRAYSAPNVHGLPMSNSEMPNNTNYNALPMVITPHGLMNEQLAALLPNHSENGSIDAQIAAQFASSQAQQNREAGLTPMETERPLLKRSYTYGTDSAFNASGYVASPNNNEEVTTSGMINDLRSAQPPMRSHTNTNGERSYSPTGHINFPVGLVEIPSDDDGRSAGDISGEGDNGNRPTKKRRTARGDNKDNKASTSARKASVATSGKNRKISVDEQNSKKKRPSTAGQKAQRENLTEEQKRSNHILSEQRRRNQIKRGFDDLHELVPEIRNGGMSKSGVLTEAANFLDLIVADNNKYMNILRSFNG